MLAIFQENSSLPIAITEVCIVLCWFHSVMTSSNLKSIFVNLSGLSTQVWGSALSNRNMNVEFCAFTFTYTISTVGSLQITCWLTSGSPASALQPSSYRRMVSNATCNDLSLFQRNLCLETWSQPIIILGSLTSWTFFSCGSSLTFSLPSRNDVSSLRHVLPVSPSPN